MAGGRPVRSAPVCGNAATCVSTEVEAVGIPAGQASGIPRHRAGGATRTPRIGSSAALSVGSASRIPPVAASNSDGVQRARRTADAGRTRAPTPYRARRSCACPGNDVAR